MDKRNLNNYNLIVRSFVQTIHVVGKNTPLGLRIQEAFLFASIHPFNWLSDYIEIKQLREALMYSILVTNTELLNYTVSLCLGLWYYLAHLLQCEQFKTRNSRPANSYLILPKVESGCAINARNGAGRLCK